MLVRDNQISFFLVKINKIDPSSDSRLVSGSISEVYFAMLFKLICLHFRYIVLLCITNK